MKSGRFAFLSLRAYLRSLASIKMAAKTSGIVVCRRRSCRLRLLPPPCQKFFRSFFSNTILLKHALGACLFTQFVFVSFSWASMAIMQGMTNSQSTELFVLRKKAENLTYSVWSDGKLESTPMIITTGQRNYSKWVVDHVKISGIKLNNVYEFKIINPVGELLDLRQFSALDTDSVRPFRFVMASCMHDGFSDQYEMWKAVENEKPEIIFLVGDTVYADRDTDGTEAGIWQRYVDTRRTLQIFSMPRLIPILATWDDHDFGSNDGYSDFPLSEKTQKIFADFYLSSEAQGFTRGPGVASHLQVFGQQFFFMDDRTWRSPMDAPHGAHWGDQQEQWLQETLLATPKPAWILNGSQFFGGYFEKDSYESLHPQSMQYTFQYLREFKYPFVLGSGDVHFSEIMNIESEIFGFETLELTSSSIHSYTFPWHQHRRYNPRRIESTWRHNFLTVDVHAISRQKLHLVVRSIGEESEELFKIESDVVR